MHTMRFRRSRSNTQNITLRLPLNVLPYDRVDKSLTCATPRKNKGSSKYMRTRCFMED